MAKPEMKTNESACVLDLRDWLKDVKRLEQLEQLSGAHWDLEIGALTEIILERMPAPPAILFDAVPGYDPNRRVLANMLETLERTALTLNLPLDLKTIPLIDALRAKLRALEPIKPNIVSSGPVMENVEQGDAVDLLKFPVPRWHAGDGGRYLGTAHLVVTRDPETGVENVGCYRVMLQDKDKVGLYISPGKHGKMHYEKAMRAGKPFPVAMVFGQHPLLFIASSQAVPFGVNEYDWTGGILGRPIDVIEGPLTGLHFPANSEIAIEGEIIPGETLPEGPFGEWPGYYASARRAEPFMRVKALYYRNDPIICGAAPFKPTIHGMYRSCLRAATVWNGMEQAGVPDIKGVYLPPPAQRFMIVVAIKQRYPGHAKQAALVASQCHAGAYLGRYVVVVDEDIDITNLNEVVWAMCTRSDPVTSVDILRRAWSGPLDPIIPPGQKGHNSRMIIEAVRPYEWRDRFPDVSQINDETRQKYSAKWDRQLAAVQARHTQARD
ncbi:MAG TPA: UbiD family decarboxylase [Candidatus Acidoferrales bacterium]|nr:UbiD family decarboxylase [Candidatus Acidoferrales bacterium]